MKQTHKAATGEQREALERFIDDCIYIEDNDEKRSIPSLVVYLIFLEWSRWMAPTMRLTFRQFNDMLFEFMPGSSEFKDADAIAAWTGIDLTQLAHLYFGVSKLGQEFRSWTERPQDDNDTGPI